MHCSPEETIRCLNNFSQSTGLMESYSGGGTTVEQLLLSEYAEKHFHQTFEEYLQNQVCSSGKIICTRLIVLKIQA